MPYSLTTLGRSEVNPNGRYIAARRAFATLDEAQEYIDQIDYHYEIPEEGGTITLEDGTMIEVGPIEWLDIYAALDVSADEAEEHWRVAGESQSQYEERVIDAYNTAQR